MTVKDIRRVLEKYPDDMDVTIIIQHMLAGAVSHSSDTLTVREYADGGISLIVSDMEQLKDLIRREKHLAADSELNAAALDGGSR